jgi:hypothetical protein
MDDPLDPQTLDEEALLQQLGGTPSDPRVASDPMPVAPPAQAEDPMQAILAEIEALQSGEQSPMDCHALMALLQSGEGQ